MGLHIRSATPSDIENFAEYLSDAATGQLLHASIPYFWAPPETDIPALKTRAEWSAQRQKEILQNDLSTRYMLIVDSVTGETVAFARWHDYVPDGFKRIGYLEECGILDPKDATTWPGLFSESKDLYLKFFEEYLEGRKDYIKGEACWILDNICTRKPYRGSGAASMLLSWGLEQARKAGVPAFLEAAPDAKSLYIKHGFKDVGSQVVDLGHGEVVEITRMRAF